MSIHKYRCSRCIVSFEVDLFIDKSDIKQKCPICYKDDCVELKESNYKYGSFKVISSVPNPTEDDTKNSLKKILGNKIILPKL